MLRSLAIASSFSSHRAVSLILSFSLSLPLSLSLSLSLFAFSSASTFHERAWMANVRRLTFSPPPSIGSARSFFPNIYNRPQISTSRNRSFVTEPTSHLHMSSDTHTSGAIIIIFLSFLNHADSFRASPVAIYIYIK